MAFYVLQHGWYIQNDPVETPFNMLATNRSWGCYFNQRYQPGKITLQVSVLIIKYLVAVSLDKVTCAVFLAFKKWYGCVVQGLAI